MGNGFSSVLATLLMGLFSLPAGASQVTYHHTDALGSVVMESNETGQVVYQREYRPYGESTLDPPKDGPAYTGHVQDVATGLTYMQQRYYDPQVGRFLSVDPVTAFDGDQRHFNRYVYAYNNPYKFNDPDGRCPWCIAGAALRRMALGAAIGGGVNAGVQMLMGKGTMQQRYDGINATQVKLAAMAGAASGGVSAVSDTAKTVIGTYGANVVGNAAIGAAATQANALSEGRVASTREVATGTVVAGLVSAVAQSLPALSQVSSASPSAGMSQTQRVATENLLGDIKSGTPGFKYSNPSQTTANAAGQGVTISHDVIQQVGSRK